MDPMMQAMQQMMAQGGGPPGGPGPGGPPGMPPGMMPPMPPPQPMNVPMGQQMPESQAGQMLVEARDILQQVVELSDPAGEIADSVAGIVRELDALIGRSMGTSTPVGPARGSDGPPPAGARRGMVQADEAGAFLSPGNAIRLMGE